MVVFLQCHGLMFVNIFETSVCIGVCINIYLSINKFNRSMVMQMNDLEILLERIVAMVRCYYHPWTALTLFIWLTLSLSFSRYGLIFILHGCIDIFHANWSSYYLEIMTRAYSSFVRFYITSHLNVFLMFFLM